MTRDVVAMLGVPPEHVLVTDDPARAYTGMPGQLITVRDPDDPDNLSPDQDVPVLVRSFAACLASVTEVPITQVPHHSGELTRALAGWRSWLAGHDAGLVAIASPVNRPGIARGSGSGHLAPLGDGVSIHDFTFNGSQVVD
jgi:hypothetical protein